MKKEIKSFLLISIILMFSISFISAGFFSDFFGKNTGQVASEDTGDGGILRRILEAIKNIFTREPEGELIKEELTIQNLIRAISGYQKSGTKLQQSRDAPTTVPFTGKLMTPPDVITIFDIKEDSREVRVIIEFKETPQTSSLQGRQKILDDFTKQNQATIKINRQYKIVDATAVTITPETLTALKKDSRVKKIHPDYERYATQEPPNSVLQESGTQTNAPAGLSGEGVVISIIDTGVDYTHPDLGGCLGPECKVIGGYDFVNDDFDPMDDHYHGTHVAAIAVGYGNDGYRGTAPRAKIMAYKVLNENGYGFVSDTIAALEASLDPNGDGDTEDRVDIVSMSLGSPFKSDIEEQVIMELVENGVTVIAAAGNSGPKPFTVGYPGGSDPVITVAATCTPEAIAGNNWWCIEGDIIAGFSSRGPEVGTSGVAIDVAAPGTYICAAEASNPSEDLSDLRCGERRIRISGTSMATPYVSGLAARLLQEHPDWDHYQVREALRANAISAGSGLLLTLAQGAGVVDKDQFNVNPDITGGVRNVNSIVLIEKEETARIEFTVDSGVNPAVTAYRIEDLETGNFLSEYEPSYSINENVVTVMIPPEDSGWTLVEANVGNDYGWGYSLFGRVPEGLVRKPAGVAFMIFAPTIADLDKDGVEEIIIDSATFDTKYLTVFSNHEEQNGWPVSLEVPTGQSSGVTSVVANLDADENLEIAHLLSPVFGSGRELSVYNHDGTELTEWVHELLQYGPIQLLPIKILRNMQNGQKNVIDFADLSRKILKLGPYGARDEIEVPYKSVQDFAINPHTGHTAFITAEDNIGEILHILKDGNTVAIVELGMGGASGASSPIFVDFDQDGEYEIFVVGPKKEDTRISKEIFIDLEGNVKKEQTSASFGFSLSLPFHVPAAGYSEGKSYIIYTVGGGGNNKLIIINPDYSRTIVNAEMITYQPLLADIDDDDALEIVTSNNGAVMAYELSGEEIPYLFDWNPLMYFYNDFRAGIVFAPAVGDVDGDGKNEIIITLDSLLSSGSSIALLRPSFYWVIETEGEPQRGDWSQYMGNPQHTGTLPLPLMVGDVDEDGIITAIDAQLISRYVNGLSTQYPIRLNNSDVTLDGEITEEDADRVAECAIGLATCDVMQKDYDDAINPPESDCSDTDGGINYEERGTVTVQSNGDITTFTDQCDFSGGTLNEYYCDGNDSAVQKYSCPNVCLNGACTVKELILYVGDVDEDGVITAIDAQIIARFVEGLPINFEIRNNNADVTSDGSITIEDANLVAQCSVGLATCDVRQEDYGITNSNSKIFSRPDTT